MSLFTGLKLIFHTSVLKNTQQGKENNLVLSNDKSIHCLLHLPTKKEKGLIISLTGFSMSGYKDNRISTMNNAFAKLGYRVITPQIQTIDSLIIHPRAIDEVKDVIQCISNDLELNPHHFSPAVFAPSFTAGIASLAIAEMPQNSVSALCLLGSFCNFESTIEFALTNEKNTDDYGMHILMKNFLKYEVGDNPSLEKIIQTALEDNGLKRKTPQLPQVLQQTDKETVELYKKLRFNTEFRREVIMRAWTKIPDFSMWRERLDLSKHAHKISCPMSIIHGKDDAVIPSSESVLLHTLVDQTNQKTHLELSNLLDHGDLKISASIFKEIANLAKAFDYFFEHVGLRK